MKPGETFTNPITGKAYIAIKDHTCNGCAFDGLPDCKQINLPACSEMFNSGISIQFRDVTPTLDNGTVID